MKNNTDNLSTALVLFPERIPEPKDLNDVEMKTFEHLAQENHKRWFYPLIFDFVERTEIRNGWVMDVACGPGFLSKELREMLPDLRISALDNSDESLRLARANLKDLDIEVIKGSVYEIPVDDESLDGVICKDSFHHFDHAKEALKEMIRVIKPGGYLYINDLKRDLPYFLIAYTEKVMNDPAMQGTSKASVAQLQYYSARAAYTKDEMACFLKEINVSPIVLSDSEVTPQAEENFQRLNINIDELRKGNSTRYTLVVRKG